MTNLSYPLFNASFIDPRTGQISRPWQQWLTALWVRVGEANAPALGDLATVIEAQYLVATSNAVLTNERVVTNTTTVTWDFSIAGQARANVDTEVIQDVIGGMLADTATIDLTYDDGANQIRGDIVDASVTYTKMQPVSAASRLLGRGSSGAGAVEELSLGSGLSMSGTSLTAQGLRWEPLTTGEIINSQSLNDITEDDPVIELVFYLGDVIMVEVP